MGLYTLLIIFLTNPSNIIWNKSITNSNSQRFEPLWNFLWFAIGLIMGQVNTNLAFGGKQTQTRFFFPFLLIFWSFLRKERKERKDQKKEFVSYDVCISRYEGVNPKSNTLSTKFCFVIDTASRCKLHPYGMSLTLNTQTSRRGVKDLLRWYFWYTLNIPLQTFGL